MLFSQNPGSAGTRTDLGLQHRDRDVGGSGCVDLLLLSGARQLMLQHFFQGVELLIAGEAHVDRRGLHVCEERRNNTVQVRPD